MHLCSMPSYLGSFGATKMTQGLSVLTGCTAGATEAVVVVPFECVDGTCASLTVARLVKIRLQDRASTYSGPIDVIRKTIASDGVLGMYKGLESTVWRHVMWSAGARFCARTDSRRRRLLRVHLPGQAIDPQSDEQGWRACVLCDGLC